MLIGVRVEIKRRGIRHIASGIIGNDGDVIAYLVLNRIAFERSKGVAHGNVRCPRDAAICAERIEQLGIRVIRSVSRVQPHRIDPSIGGYRQRAKPVPLVVIDWVVINPVRRAKSYSAVGAAREHYVCPGVEACRLNARQHVNVVIGRAARTIHYQEALPCQAAWIDRVAEIETAAKVDLGDLIKGRRDIPDSARCWSEGSKTGC